MPANPPIVEDNPNMDNKDDTAISSAHRTFAYEIEGLQRVQDLLDNGLGEVFSEAVALMQSAKGRVIVSGIGKSGHVGQKIAATFSSTGTPSFFVHPSEASHGDLGMITKDDIILALSWSGETAELTNIISYSRRFRVPLISITSKSESALAKNSDLVICLPKVKEACPHGLAPTSSTIMQLAIGDALAIALLEAKGFSASDFKTFHPGGQLGAKLKPVQEIMHSGDRLPLITKEVKMSEALVVMSEKSFGCLGIQDHDDRLIGVITDGDLRRNMNESLLSLKAEDIMKSEPITVEGDLLASAALDLLNKHNITSLFVLKEEKPIGIIHIHDLLRLGVV